MLELADYTLIAATAAIALALIGYAMVVAGSRAPSRHREAVLAGAGAQADGAVDPSPPAVDPSPPDAEELPDGDYSPEPAAGEPATTPRRGVSRYAGALVIVAAVLITVALVVRTIATGHPPFANQYEFAVSFAWGMTVCFAWFDRRYRVGALALVVLPVILGMLLYADTQDATPSPLIPALQNSVLLTLHVFTAALAYGAACVSFGAAVLYLLHPRLRWRALPTRERLDAIGYRGVVATFPLLTVMILLGALWADTAWGRYWGWDPKETAALATWFIYGAYLHARVVRHWRGQRAAWLLVVGFAAVLFSYFGNHFFGGLHSYG